MQHYVLAGSELTRGGPCRSDMAGAPLTPMQTQTPETPAGLAQHHQSDL